MLPETKLINSFEWINTKSFKLPLITVYYNTSDYPNQYVARMFDVNKPTKYAMVKDSIEEIRNMIPKSYHRLDRQLEDDPVIQEIWV